MSKFFLWQSLDKWKAGDMPAAAAVAVGIAEHTNLHDDMLISPQLMSEREVDEAIDNLVAELERLRHKAKAVILSDNAKVIGDVGLRHPEGPKPT